MHYLLASALFFGIITLWIPAYWPVATFSVSLFGLAILGMVRRRQSGIRVAYPLVPLVFAVVWGLFQCFTGRTVSAFETRIAVASWATLLAVLLLGLVVFEQASLQRWFRSAMLWFGFVISVVATLQTFTAGGKVFWIFPTEYPERVMGPILSPNHYAAFIEIVLPFAIYQSLRRGRDSLLYAIMAAAMYASVIASASRAGVVLTSGEFVLVTLLMWLQGRASGHSLGRSAIPVGVLLAIFTAVVGWGTVWMRLRTADPFLYRREFNVSSLHMIADRPWFGFGLGTWPIVYPSYAVIDPGTFANRAHDDWLEWTADGGLPFGIAMATLFLWCLRPALASAWGVGVIAVFLHAIVDYPFSRTALAAWVVITIAMLAAPSTDDRLRTQRTEQTYE